MPLVRTTQGPAVQGTDELALRARRLTPREARILILASQGELTHADIAETLGVTRGNVASTLQRVRRKLAVPPHLSLQTFVTCNPVLAAPPLPDDQNRRPAPMTSLERRRLLLLRATIDDLEAVADRARRRAESLDHMDVTADDEAARVEEVWTMRRIAELIDDATSHALAIARRCGDAVAQSGESTGDDRSRSPEARVGATLAPVSSAT